MYHTSWNGMSYSVYKSESGSDFGNNRVTDIALALCEGLWKV
jgi:hypothetical protein